MDYDTLQKYLEEKDITKEELDNLIEPYLKKRDEKPTLERYINAHSCAAWITFCFTIDGKSYRCIDVQDFLRDYGLLNKSILTDYVVVSCKDFGHSQSQGSCYVLEVEKKTAQERR